MPTIEQLLEEQTSVAIHSVTGASAPAIMHTADPRFGDYQANGVMAVAKQLKLNPRELAEKVVAQLRPNLSGITLPPEVAGPGFINFRLDPTWLGQTLLAAAQSERLGVESAAQPETIVIDFSAPNIAKPMHVGHIRSTIIGDALTRVLRFLGHQVITDNHLGDWGTQFGMLIVGYRTVLDQAAYTRDPLAEMERIYKVVQAQAKEDPAVATQARQELAKLQKGNSDNLALWQEFVTVSRQAFEEIYARLGVEFDHWLGESFYNPMLAQVVTELREKGLARESEGAICVFYDDSELSGNPFLIQKQDGAFLYATTDLATVRYRAERFGRRTAGRRTAQRFSTPPDRIIYVTDARQQLHFRQLFAAVKQWGYTMQLEHVWFGTILGEDGRPIKTREGEPIKLMTLLDEAEQRARAIVEEKNPDLTTAQQARVARVVGMGAVKYADLSQNRTSDYRFSWDKMLALDGNTAPYLQYAYARIRSIFRKGALEGWQPSADLVIFLEASEEVNLAKQIVRFGDALRQVSADYKPNVLTGFLYDLATKFNIFYQTLPVLKAPPANRPTRLLLCGLTSRMLYTGLDLLGIETLEAM